MTRGTVKNNETGLEIVGKHRGGGDFIFEFVIDGSSRTNTMNRSEWSFTPEPRKFEDGVYAPYTERPEMSRILKYRSGEWRDAEGYALSLEDLPRSIDTWVRLVPEVMD